MSLKIKYEQLSDEFKVLKNELLSNQFEFGEKFKKDSDFICKVMVEENDKMRDEIRYLKDLIEKHFLPVKPGERVVEPVVEPVEPVVEPVEPVEHVDEPVVEHLDEVELVVN